MKTLAAGLIGLALVLAPAALAQDRQNNKTMDADMQRAIQFERYKDAADARQAAIEKTHQSVAEPGANRSAEADRAAADSGTQNSERQSADREDLSGNARSEYSTQPTSQELQRAVAWEHFKDAAAARQAAMEGHGTIKVDKNK